MLTPEMARMAASQMSSLSPDQVEQMASNLPPEQMRQFAAMTQSGPGMAGPPGGGTQVGGSTCLLVQADGYSSLQFRACGVGPPVYVQPVWCRCC